MSTQPRGTELYISWKLKWQLQRLAGSALIWFRCLASYWSGTIILLSFQFILLEFVTTTRPPQRIALPLKAGAEFVPASTSYAWPSRSLASSHFEILVKSAQYSPMQASITTAVPNFSTNSQNFGRTTTIQKSMDSTPAAEHIDKAIERMTASCNERTYRLIVTMVAVIAFALMKLIAMFKKPRI